MLFVRFTIVRLVRGKEIYVSEKLSDFSEQSCKENQKNLTPVWFEPDKSTSYISFSFVLFLECSRENVMTFHAHKMLEH